MLRRSIYIVLTTVLVGISFGCSKEVDEAPNPVQAPLTGVWEAYLYTFQGNFSTVFPDDFEFTEFAAISLELDIFMTFEENPNTYSLEGPYLMEYSETHEGDTQQYLLLDVFEDQGSWTIDGNIITLMIDGEEVTAGISQLSDTTLILRINTSRSEIEDDNFTTTTINKEESYYFQRISF